MSPRTVAALVGLLVGCSVPDYATEELFACDGDRQCAEGHFCDRAARVCVVGQPPPPDGGWRPDAGLDGSALDQGVRDAGPDVAGGDLDPPDFASPDGGPAEDADVPPGLCAEQPENGPCGDDEGRLAWCVAARCCPPDVMETACNARAVGHPLPFPEDYGDDAYAAVVGDADAVEHRTGLRWHIAVTRVGSAAAGQAWCDALPWAPEVGRWRLPDWHELATLQLARTGGAPAAWLDPLIDPLGDALGQFVSRTRQGDKRFAYDGRRNLLGLVDEDDTVPLYALCVARRKEPRPKDAWSVPVGLGGRDEWTGREWADYVGTLPFAQAQALCADGAGLPTVAELGSLMDFSQNPPLDRITGQPDARTFWTREDFSGVVRVVDFTRGEVRLDSAANGMHHVRCIKSRVR